ncbi:MAG TPA: hypothetical protein PLZ08_10790 [Bacillota bacterium]|jgi:hypothetical protein|nr:hypothetical protein [Bacillota bacterium]HOL10640.1 hypothetical protein [Bacillota bacterium]HPO98425.1 hypothetical protein [Bacillota bacterium]
MSEERLKILQMIEEKKITATEGFELLSALSEGAEKVNSQSVTPSGQRFLRVRVTGDKVKKINVNLPLSLVKVASKFASLSIGFIPEEARKEMEKKGIDLSKIDINEIVTLIDQGLLDEKLVDLEVDDETDGRIKVEVYVD